MKTPTTKEPSSMDERFREKFQSTPTSEKTFADISEILQFIEGEIQDERKKIFDSPTEEKARDSFEDYIIAKERERVREMIEGMKNKEFETREHGFSKGGVNIGSAQYTQALQDLLNKLDS